jgi:regulator of PEP synthase PpsR (kinase-PPPase family)
MIDFQPHEEPWAMEAYHTWARIFELHRDYYWIVDRFHISTRSHQLVYAARDFQFEWLEERLHALNFHLVHCVRQPETFAHARAERLTYSENPTRYDDLQIFVEEQDLMRRLMSESRLRTLEVDVSDNDVDRAATTILDWVESTGGFWKVG